MKKLEAIFNILIRIVNIPLVLITVIAHGLASMLFLFVAIPLEFLLVMPIFYIVTGEWYYNKPFNYKHLWVNWFPIIENIEVFINILPIFRIKEIHFKNNKQ